MVVVVRSSARVAVWQSFYYLPADSVGKQVTYFARLRLQLAINSATVTERRILKGQSTGVIVRSKLPVH